MDITLLNSLCTLLNLEELVKVEDDSRNVAEQEDADDAYQDGRKVHLFKTFKTFQNIMVYSVFTI